MDQNNNRRSGGISVETAHIFPIIKKWLYSEKDIFLRELVSNAADAVTKHKRLISLGEIESSRTRPTASPSPWIRLRGRSPSPTTASA